jgi:hypothetical protein
MSKRWHGNQEKSRTVHSKKERIGKQIGMRRFK